MGRANLIPLSMYTGMKIPEPVRAFFDSFPLQTLPPQALPNQPDTQRSPLSVAVYSLDPEGLPIDPKCLEAVALLLLAGKSPTIKQFSPYISSAETLPLVYDRDQGTTSVVTKVPHLAHNYFPETAKDPKYKVYRSLVDTWLDDAWHETMMNATQQMKTTMYGSLAGQFPWPFSVLANRDLDTHLDEKVNRNRRATGDDYACSEGNMNRAKMTLHALTAAVDPNSEKLKPIDMLVFSYIWPISEYFPESALAALIPPELRDHAQHIRQFLLSYRH